jgi:hypothetical protein
MARTKRKEYVQYLNYNLRQFSFLNFTKVNKTRICFQNRTFPEEKVFSILIIISEEGRFFVLLKTALLAELSYCQLFLLVGLSFQRVYY